MGDCRGDDEVNSLIDDWLREDGLNSSTRKKQIYSLITKPLICKEEYHQLSQMFNLILRLLYREVFSL